MFRRFFTQLRRVSSLLKSAQADAGQGGKRLFEIVGNDFKQPQAGWQGEAQFTWE
jgi:hypothetical protein